VSISASRAAPLLLSTVTAGVTLPLCSPSAHRFEAQISKLKSVAERCSRRLRAWADYLQNSEIRGRRHLTEKTLTRCRSEKSSQEFEQELLEHMRGG
jgi:hypothetical protein